MANGVSSLSQAGNALPLVSIFMFVRNGASTIRRAIDSVLAQTYSNIEFIVQDAASTDGTLEILASYGDRLKVVSVPDSGPNEGLWRALRRCNGAFVGSCLADEELLPDAVERAVGILMREHDIGAITGDAIITDIDGAQTGFWKSGPFNLIDYLLCDYTPYFCSSFFRRQALLEAGLESEAWGSDCIEFELWCRLATRSPIKYVSQTNAKYASHANQSSNNARDVAIHFRGRINQITAMCSAGGFFSESPLLRALFIWGQTRAFVNHAIAFKRPAIAETVHRIARETLAQLPPVLLDDVPYNENYGRPPSGPPATSSIGSIVRRLFQCHRNRRRVGAAEELQLPMPPPVDKHLKARMYAELALRYEANDRPQEALEVLRAAADLCDLKGLDHTTRALERIGYTALTSG
jgi:glycosyltransferase involved in cell wall biosynthesis